MSSSTNSGDNIPHHAVEQAAAWLARRRAGPWSEVDAAAFQRWLNVSPDNARAWDSQERLWATLGAVREAPAVLAMRESIRNQTWWRRVRRFSWQAGAGLAASCVFGIVVWQWRSHDTQVMRTTASSALLVPDAGQLKPLTRISDVSTRIGERALVQLADGTRVTLNTDSAIHVDLTGSERRVTLLRGHAYFEVARDREHPFVVSAGTHQVVALGTAFDVRLQSQQVQVNLVEGKVRVERVPDITVDAGGAGSADPVILEAGSSLVADVGGEQHVQPTDVERAVSWRTGKLVFDGNRLADVVAEMNRYSSQKIAILDPELNAELLSGVFDPAGGAELARTLENYGMVRIVGQDNSTIVLGLPDKTE